MTSRRHQARPPATDWFARFPTIPAEHKHVHALAENAMRYVAPQNRIIDAASGYPVEGWNHDPKRALFLRSFTQLTAIGQWMELCANVAAGYANTPHLSREQALNALAKLVGSLRRDQHDPNLSAKGLLGNFLDLGSGKRLGPLASDVEKHKIIAAFGPEKADAIWKALTEKGWITPRNNDREADIVRGPKYGSDFFDGPLVPYSDPDTRREDHGHPRSAGGDGRLWRQCKPVGIGREDDRSAACFRTQRELGRRPDTPGTRAVLRGSEGRIYTLVRSEGRPVLLRTRRDQEPVVWVGRPRRQLEDRPRGLPRQRVSRPSDVCCVSIRNAHGLDQKPGAKDEALPND